jgi:hypothetical protein
MKKVFILLLSTLSLVSSAQTSSSTPIDEITRIIENYETCNGFFCFESKATYEPTTGMLIVQSTRVNIDDAGNEEVTEIRIVKIPMKKGTVAKVFPDEADTIIITTEGNDIQRTINNEEEMVDYTILVFNNHFVAEKLSKPFLKNFNKVIKSNKK